jgi:hypothetical protein
MNTVKTSLKTTETWNAIPWAKVQRKVFKLQKRIFQAAKSGQDVLSSMFTLRTIFRNGRLDGG